MRIFSKPPKPQEDKYKWKLDKLLDDSYPSDEHDHQIFKKFGVRTGGIADTWLFKKDYKNHTDAEKWEYIARCALYWLGEYMYWLDKKEYEEYKTYLLETAKKRPEFMETYDYLVEQEE